MLAILGVLWVYSAFGLAIEIALAEFNPAQFGPDGPWPAAYISLGSPPQKVSLTPSTYIDGIWPILPSACGGDQAEACLNGRGRAFDIEGSSTWTAFSRTSDITSNITWAPLVNGQPYEITATGLYGSDMATIGSVDISNIAITAVSGTTVNNGYLGLRNITWEMYLQRQIPSPSWSYSVGAVVISREPSLIFGGYDVAQSIPGTSQSHPLVTSPDGVPLMQLELDLLTLNMTGRPNRSLRRANSSLLEEPITVTLDTTTPYCWLPQTITDSIADAVGAVWNETVGHYIYDPSAPGFDNLDISTLTFHFANSGPSSLLFNSVSLAHNLVLQPPAVTSNVQYLPMQPITRGNTYILGRSFLQQIYTIVDYQNSNFTISQVELSQDVPHSYVTIAAPVVSPRPTTTSGTTSSTATTTSTSTSTTAAQANSGNGLSGGAIGGIAVGVIAAVALLLGLLFFVYRRKRKNVSNGDPRAFPSPPLPPDQFKGVYPSELEHNHRNVHREELDASAGLLRAQVSELPAS